MYGPIGPPKPSIQQTAGKRKQKIGCQKASPHGGRRINYSLDVYKRQRAGRAAGCVTVMVPDLMQPTEEIAQLYDRKCEDLLEVRDLLIEGKL